MIPSIQVGNKGMKHCWIRTRKQSPIHVMEWGSLKIMISFLFRIPQELHLIKVEITYDERSEAFVRVVWPVVMAKESYDRIARPSPQNEHPLSFQPSLASQQQRAKWGIPYSTNKAMTLVRKENPWTPFGRLAAWLAFDSSPSRNFDPARKDWLVDENASREAVFATGRNSF